MKVKLLLVIAFLATMFNSAFAQFEYGNVTTPLTGAKTWDFSQVIPGLDAGDLTEAGTVDNLYFGCTGDTYITKVSHPKIMG